MTSPLRIGIVGAGENTRRKHIPGFQALPGVIVTTVANRSRASSERVAREFGLPHVAEDWREVVASPEVDAVCIGTWPYLHAEVAIAALRAGKSVLTEARMATDATGAVAMWNALEAARAAHPGLVAQIVPSPVTLPFDSTVRALLAAGELGELREVLVAHTHAGYADPSAPIVWRQRAEWSGVNMLTLGIYYEAVLRWLDADAEVVAVDAAIFTPERPDESGRRVQVDIPDSVTVLGRYPGGARLVAHFSGVERGEPRNEIRLHGSRASLRLDLAAGRLWLTRAGEHEQPVGIPAERRGGWRVEADFVDSIRTGAPVTLTDFATGVRYMRFTEAVWRAWKR